MSGFLYGTPSYLLHTSCRRKGVDVSSAKIRCQLRFSYSRKKCVDVSLAKSRCQLMFLYSIPERFEQGDFTSIGLDGQARIRGIFCVTEGRIGGLESATGNHFVFVS